MGVIATAAGLRRPARAGRIFPPPPGRAGYGDPSMSTSQARARSVVLCYHAVSDDWPSSLAVRPRQLRAQVAHLLRRGYRPATFSAAVAGRGMLAVTFDDAFASVGSLALPVLRDLGVPATIFVPTAFPDSRGPLVWPGLEQWRGGPHADELACLGWDDLAALAECGWEIGSHTVTHPLLTQLDDQRLAAEVSESKRAVETRLGRTCSSIAYPYGDEDGRVVAAARRAGYAAAAALSSRPHGDERLRWPRIGVYRGDGLLRLAAKTAPSLRRLREHVS
jgi:peptidoglycan/xylan/chitin deacetylase (PgdA/CDA1 family)